MEGHLQTVLEDARYKQAITAEHPLPAKKIPELSRWFQVDRFLRERQMGCAALTHEPLGLWFLERFADVEVRAVEHAESLTLGDDEHEERLLLRFARAFHARRRLDIMRVVPTDDLLDLVLAHRLHRLRGVRACLAQARARRVPPEAAASGAGFSGGPASPGPPGSVPPQDDVWTEDESSWPQSQSQSPSQSQTQSQAQTQSPSQAVRVHPYEQERQFAAALDELLAVAMAQDAAEAPVGSRVSSSDGDSDSSLDPAASPGSAASSPGSASGAARPLSAGARAGSESQGLSFSQQHQQRPRRGDAQARRPADVRRERLLELRPQHPPRAVQLTRAAAWLVRAACAPMFARLQRTRAAQALYCRFRAFAEAPVASKHVSTLRVLGRGATGRVYACVMLHTGRVLAMKVMPKKLVKHRRAMRQVTAERAALEALARHPSPYCMRLRYAYETAEAFHFILPLAVAGDLRYHLRNGPFALQRALTYAAEVAVGLGHLHALGFVMRDLKPRNILLEADGHCRISDFGLAADVSDGMLIRGRAGTVGYWSPQVLNNGWYGQDADWWSFGVCVYEFVAGFNPFSTRHTGLASRNDGTLEAPVTFPPEMDVRAQKLLAALLQREPARRAGCGGRDAAEVLDGDTFPVWADVDVQAVRRGTHAAAWVPSRGVIYAQSEATIAKNEERKQPDLRKVRVLPTEMPAFPAFTAAEEHLEDVVAVIGHNCNVRQLEERIVARHERDVRERRSFGMRSISSSASVPLQQQDQQQQQQQQLQLVPAGAATNKASISAPTLLVGGDGDHQQQQQQQQQRGGLLQQMFQFFRLP